MAMDGAMAPRRQGTARRLLDGEGWRDGSLTARGGASAPRRQGSAQAWRRWTESTTAMGGDGQSDGEWMVMDGAALRRWTAQRQLDCEEWRDGDLTTMDNEEQRRERDGDVNTAGGGSNKGQCVITL